MVDGTSPDDLLDSYRAERHPVGARVLHNTVAQVALGRTDDRSLALHDTVSGLLSLDEPRRRIAGMMSGSTSPTTSETGTRWSVGGCPTPRCRPRTDPCASSRCGRPLLLDLGGHGGLDTTWPARVRIVEARYDGGWELPVVGEVAAPAAVLVRPDGHVAWAGDLRDPALLLALTRWFGAPAAAAAG